MTDGYLRQEGTAAGRTGRPAVDHNLPLVRNLAVGHSPAVDRRSLVVRVPAETLISREEVSVRSCKLATSSRGCSDIALFDSDSTPRDDGIG